MKRLCCADAESENQQRGGREAQSRIRRRGRGMSRRVLDRTAACVSAFLLICSTPERAQRMLPRFAAGIPATRRSIRLEMDCSSSSDRIPAGVEENERYETPDVPERMTNLPRI